MNRLVFLFSLLGLLVAGYLWWAHVNYVDVPCGAGSGCEDVRNSRYSRFPPGSGPPVAAFGAIGYLGLAALAFLRTLTDRPARDRRLLGLVVLGAAAGTLFSLWLTYLELFVIKAVCKWCLASQFLIVGVLAASLVEWLRGRRAQHNPFFGDDSNA